MSLWPFALKWHGTLAALRHVDFRWYFSGQMVSMSGTWMQRIAQAWLVFQLTGDAGWLGAVAFVTGFPSLILSPVAGVLADRWSRANLMQVAYAIEMLLALLLSLLTALDVVQVWHVAVIATGFGMASAFSEPSRQAFMHDLVGADDLHSGIALNAMVVNFAQIVGPGLAGIILVAVGAAWCFFLNGLTFLAIIAVLWKIRRPATPHQVRQPASILEDTREGLRYALRHPVIGPLLLLAAIINGLGISMIFTLLPAFADIALRSPTVGYTMLSVSAAIGSLIGSVFNVMLAEWLGRERVIRLTVLVLPWMAIVFATAHILSVSIFIHGVLGLTYTLFFVTVNITLQTTAPSNLRGRVLSLWTLNRFGLAPILALVIGLLAQQTGVVETMIVSSVVAGLFVALIVFRKQPSILSQKTG
jgi:MFS family permease